MVLLFKKQVVILPRAFAERFHLLYVKQNKKQLDIFVLQMTKQNKH